MSMSTEHNLPELLRIIAYPSVYRKDIEAAADLIESLTAELAQREREIDWLRTELQSAWEHYEKVGWNIDRLRELVQADAEGRCVVLPCKVGDTVFVNSGCLYIHKAAPYTPCEVVVIKKTKREISMHLRPLCRMAAGTRYHRWFGASSIGKTVFLSRQEAEAALKEEI